jgi:hypothetical protein
MNPISDFSCVYGTDLLYMPNLTRFISHNLHQLLEDIPGEGYLQLSCIPSLSMKRQEFGPALDAMIIYYLTLMNCLGRSLYLKSSPPRAHPTPTAPHNRVAVHN